MKRILQLALVTSAMYLLIGCSADSVQILSQATQAKPGDTITIKLVNAYLYLTDTSRLNAAATRDSFHVAFGLPDGWSVVSMSYYPAYNFKVPGILNGGIDTAALLNQDYSKVTQQINRNLDQSFAQNNLQDSLAKFEAGQMPMIRDNGMKAAFAGRTIDAHDQLNVTTIKVSTDSVKNWSAYSSIVSLICPAGTKTDTAVGVPDTINSLIVLKRASRSNGYGGGFHSTDFRLRES